MQTNVKLPVILPKHGGEQFHVNNDELGFSIKDFWIWSASDLMNNVTRGHLAEFIVAKAIGAAEGVRNEWATYDLTTPNGTKVEVKSASYLQSWPQDDYSTIQFSIRKTKALDWEKGGYRGIPKRHADVYVFALLAYKKENTIKDKESVRHHWQIYRGLLKRLILGFRCPIEEATARKLLDMNGFTGTNVVRAKLCQETYSVII